MEKLEITIIGLGGLGHTLLSALTEHKDVTIKSIFNRDAEKASRLGCENDIDIIGSFPTGFEQLGQLVFVTVSDGAIAGVARRLSELGNNFSDKTIIHCSGNEPASLLHLLKDRGAKTASFHPLQTFSRQSTVKDFNNIYFSMQGDEDIFPVLDNIARKLGAQTISVTKEQKSYLHAAAVVASNYLITLIDSSVKIAARSGLNEKQASHALLPLIETTLKNAENGSLAEILTGPIKRGDLETIRSHITLLQGEPNLLKLYRELGLQTVHMVRSSGHFDETIAKEMNGILKKN